MISINVNEYWIKFIHKMIMFIMIPISSIKYSPSNLIVIEWSILLLPLLHCLYSSHSWWWSFNISLLYIQNNHIHSMNNHEIIFFELLVKHITLKYHIWSVEKEQNKTKKSSNRLYRDFILQNFFSNVNVEKRIERFSKIGFDWNLILKQKKIIFCHDDKKFTQRGLSSFKNYYIYHRVKYGNDDRKYSKRTNQKKISLFKS